MAEETAIVLLSAMVGIVAICLGYMVGRFLDPVWKCRMMRRFLKKPYIVMKICQKDGLLIDTRVVNAEKDVVVLENDMWVITKGSVHVQSKSKNAKKGDLDKTSGFNIKDQVLRQEEGAPTIYVDKDSIKPRGFYKMEEEEVKPSEIGSTLLAWVYNQYAKALAGINQHKQLIIVCLLLGVINLAIVWQMNEKVQAIDDRTKHIEGMLAGEGGAVTIPKGATVQNGSINIQGAAGK